MRTLTDEMRAALAGETSALCSCWRVTRKDGLVMGFTSADTDLVIGGVTYSAASGYEPSASAVGATLAVGNLDVSGVLAVDLDVHGVTAADIRAGKYDYARVEIFVADWERPERGVIVLHRGYAGQLTVKDADYHAEVRGLAAALEQSRGEVYSPDCRADLGDARCKVNLSLHRASASVTARSSDGVFTAAALTQASGYFTGGRLAWISGANAGREMEIRVHEAGGVVALFEPMASPVAVGDLFDVWPGCDKTFATCRAKFANAINFRGEPHLPGQDAVLLYPDAI